MMHSGVNDTDISNGIGNWSRNPFPTALPIRNSVFRSYSNNEVI